VSSEDVCDDGASALRIVSSTDSFAPFIPTRDGTDGIHFVYTSRAEMGSGTRTDTKMRQNRVGHDKKTVLDQIAVDVGSGGSHVYHQHRYSIAREFFCERVQ